MYELVDFSVHKSVLDCGGSYGAAINAVKEKFPQIECYLFDLPKGGTLYVIENCADKINIDLSLLSLNMAVMCQSFERTSTEYIDLVQSARFVFQKNIKLNELQTVLIF
ncbi:hypothetical protein AGMMS49965_21800 [Bacteroidia bacterium]|nr:hypothetical protein AGMMS49965_21800 [Bacteroidia bacterium]